MGSVCSTSEDGSHQSNVRTAPADNQQKPSRLSRSKDGSNGREGRSNASMVRRKVFSNSRMGDRDEGKLPHKHAKSQADVLVIRKALQEQTILSALAEYDLDEMIQFMDVINLRKGQAAEMAGCLCVVLEGAVMIGFSSDSFKQKVGQSDESDRHEAGSAFGQFGLVHDSLRSSNGSILVRAVDDSNGSQTRICKLPGSAYRTCMEFSRQAQIKANMRLLASIPIFAKLSNPERVHISDSSQVKTYAKGEVIVQEGEPGEWFYILRSGGAAVTRGTDRDGEPQRIDYKYAGDYFGEAALLEDAPRNATVTADEARTEALVVGREIFNQRLLGPLKDIMDRSMQTIQQQMIVTVPLLSQLTAEKRMRLGECLQRETFQDGQYIFRQNDSGDKLYIIISGEVSVLSSVQLNASLSGCLQAREIDRLYSGQYFGERALVKDEPRMASVQATGKVELYSLSKAHFEGLEVRKTVAWSRRWDEEDTRDVAQLKVIKPLGSGAFGTAWLVRHKTHGRTYALKSLDKLTIKRQNWTSVVVREKDILARLPPHPCVITLHNAFQSPTQLFMLMELATGGELFALIEKFERFQLDTARFFAACVVLAIGHLHKHGVIFRDLKPENLLLTSKGYLKLIDMGFAKRLGHGEKTYTLCGTPYYLAPEMILHRGHSFPLDWWCVGVLTYEMIEGEPPFSGSSEMEVYGKVTRLQYSCSDRFNDNSSDFVIKMLKKEPEGRLGNLRNGVDDIMSHPWFYNQSWEQVFDGTYPAPYLPPPPNHAAPKTNASSPPILDLSETMTNPNDFGYWPNW